jgi:hypothetical protein
MTDEAKQPAGAGHPAYLYGYILSTCRPDTGLSGPSRRIRAAELNKPKEPHQGNYRLERL